MLPEILLPLIALAALASAQPIGGYCNARRGSSSINGINSSFVTLAAGSAIQVIDDYYRCPDFATDPYAPHFFYTASLRDQSEAQRTAFFNISFDYNNDTTVFQVLNKDDSNTPLVSGYGNLCMINIDGEHYTFPPNAVSSFVARYGASELGSVLNITLDLIRNDVDSKWASGTARTLLLEGLDSPVAGFVISDLEGGKAYEFILDVELVSANSITYYASSSCEPGTGNSWTLNLGADGSGRANFSISPGADEDTYFIYAARDDASTGSFVRASLAVGGSNPVDPNNSSDPCFPASATVLLSSGVSTPLAALNIGDTIATGSSSAPLSPVFFFSHRNAQKSYPFTRIHTADGNAIALSGSHYIFANGKLTAAREVVPGDRLERGDGEAVAVVSIEKRVWLQGLYNPHTVADTMVVDGFKVSCFTTAVEPRLARALLWPLKVAFETMGVAMPGAFLRDGWDRVAQMIPGGKKRYAM
mmetsp:Transcript_4416/g.10808  ORF Transcript_4416/g.10808 Transcript_4416/m.10808 type:complete len:475 (-) Transcript_4416:157-1581(-)